jgi:hypothetical protein
MAPQILQWTTSQCVEFLRKCAKQYASTISDVDLEIYVANFEQNHVAGSTILTFSDGQWKDLIPSIGFGNFVRQQLQMQEKICQQEMRTAVWRNSARHKPSEGESKRTLSLKDMPSRLTMTSFFQRVEKKTVTDEADILENTVTTESGTSTDVPSICERNQILTASNVENFVAQLAKNQDGKSTLLFRRACLELCALLQNNKSDTARRIIRLYPNNPPADFSQMRSLVESH